MTNKSNNFVDPAKTQTTASASNEITGQGVDENFNDSVSAVITGLLSSIENQRKRELDKSKFEELEPFQEDLARAIKAINELNPEHFDLWADKTLIFGGRASDILKHKLQVYLTSKDLPKPEEISLNKAVFLLNQYAFVDAHFTALIKQYEGWACSADKVRTITNRLLKHLVLGNPIEWNYNQEYTYHLPKEIFTNQEQVLEFFDSLYFFYYGRTEKFLTFMGKLPKAPV